ncbi:hypothetical protein SBI_09350 [Streptomyces bingchenggensis BCW-1]|uniref:Uncharacterized protein n=1 Tax=Streptomyces bingchenggensis (strain BCW-1) TaxID=749414 RepID=D7C5T9_STRBB|nr:hypothetical protein SBI_09350 [Streptomyces bingchenggensis BCW-1]
MISEVRLAPAAQSGQRSCTASSSQKQTGQISYEPGDSSIVRWPQQTQGYFRVMSVILPHNNVSSRRVSWD